MTPATVAAAAPASSTILADYDFVLPADCIAQEPAPARDGARLLVLGRTNGARQHAHVTDLPQFLRAGDLLVINDTRVIPARLRAHLAGGTAVELLVTHEVETDATITNLAPTTTWRCLGRPGKKLKAGVALEVADGVAAVVTAVHTDGQIDVRFDVRNLNELLERHGSIPLPPYIRRSGGPTTDDYVRYQTIFAQEPGSVAAPTAGLHFTPTLIAALRRVGVDFAPLTLHVGPGTFIPVRSEDARDHRMQPERYCLPAETAEKIAQTKRAGGRVIAVGTTTTRALEAAAATAMPLRACSGWADLFLHPGIDFKVIDALFTNFHLPRSTLLLLVSAFAGRESVLAAYGEAIERGYRFYSFGDAMLIA